MPKDRRSRSVSFDRPSPYSSRTSHRLRQSPFPSSAGGGGGSSSSSSRNPLQSTAPAPAPTDLKEWDEVRCSVCMEHPHNAVLLLCTSHDKGCRPFMCDTSYRHSNCLDQYRKSITALAAPASDGDSSKPKLFCPFCRGFVSGWKVVEGARKHMNSKARSCSTESCGFSGAYGELRKHARTEHPLVRPSEADPDRQRDWRRMEQQRDLGDLFSTMQSAIGGGDEGFTFLSDGELGGFPPSPSITLLLVLSFRGPGALSGSTNGRSLVRRGSSRSSRTRRARARILWGESIVEGEAAGSVQSDAEDTRDDDDDGDDDDDDDGDDDDDDDDDDNEDDDNDNDDDGGEEAAGSSRQHRRHSRRLLRLPDGDDDGNDGSVL